MNLAQKIYNAMEPHLLQGEEIRATGKFVVGATAGKVLLLGGGAYLNAWYGCVTSLRLLLLQLDIWSKPRQDGPMVVPLDCVDIGPGGLMCTLPNAASPIHFAYHFGLKWLTGLSKEDFRRELVSAKSSSANVERTGSEQPQQGDDGVVTNGGFYNISARPGSAPLKAANPTVEVAPERAELMDLCRAYERQMQRQRPGDAHADPVIKEIRHKMADVGRRLGDRGGAFLMRQVGESLPSPRWRSWVDSSWDGIHGWMY